MLISEFLKNNKISINEISQIVGGTNIGGSAGLSFGFKAQRELRRSWFRLKLKLVSAWFYAKRNC